MTKPKSLQQKNWESGLSRSFSQEDWDLSNRRFNEYRRLKKEDTWASFHEILMKLPLDGGTPMECGCNRFAHLTFDGCQAT